MEFRIADTFTASLTRLEGDEQKAVKTAAFDLQMNPAAPGLQFHKLDKARDKSFWSVRVSRDIRLIVHRTANSLLLCFVAHHDDAYAWAERRKLEAHPTTGAAQLVEIRETVVEIVVPQYIEAVVRETPPQSKSLLFATAADEQLLGFGVPPEWLDEVRKANEDTLLDLADHLPAEAAEALLELATGGMPAAPIVIPSGADPFSHPDAQRRFRTIEDIEELQRALDYPWERWTIFLHPSQRAIVEKEFNGPARVAGSAGTGKTVVALHRAVSLARTNPESRVLLTTFSEILANSLRKKLFMLLRNEPKIAERLEVASLDKVGESLYRGQFGAPSIATPEQIKGLLEASKNGFPEINHSLGFLTSEWNDVVDAWQLKSWNEYRDVKRLGRKIRLSEQQRANLWQVFEKVLDSLESQTKITRAGIFAKLAAAIPERTNPPYDYAVVDEAQDVGIMQLRFLAALGGNRPNALFFAGDLGQRIFQQPFSWLSLGVDIRGRSRTLHVNYRTSHQIRSQADRLLGKEVADVDGIVESRVGTVSVFNGPHPQVCVFKSPDEESDAVALWLSERIDEGIKPHEIGLFVRSESEFHRAMRSVTQASLDHYILTPDMDNQLGKVVIAAMHMAKGLEFKAVAIQACDDEIIPLQARIESVADPADLEEVYNSERNLLYVACTRARDHLIITSGGHASEFLADLSHNLNRP
ncbi:MAG: UvrD-helicase domain-containing protein [Chlorobia bacterium]|nr:UvrD-helicase domain-containing protein [Fimbriimonadaceae bacterium]